MKKILLSFALIPALAHSQFNLELGTGIQPKGILVQAGLKQSFPIGSITAEFISMIPHLEDATYFGGKIEGGKTVMVGIGAYFHLRSVDKNEYTKGQNYWSPGFTISYGKKNWRVYGYYLDQPLITIACKL